MSGYDSAILSTAMLEHPDLVRLPRGVRLLYVEALVWSKLHRTDGQIQKFMLRRITDESDIEAAAIALVESGRWTDEGDSWAIVGYLDQQWSAERVAKAQAQARVRYERMVDGRANAVTNSVTNAATNAATNDTDLIRSDPKGKRMGIRAAAPARPAAGGGVPDEKQALAKRLGVDEDDISACARCGALGDTVTSFLLAPGKSEQVGYELDSIWTDDLGTVFCWTCRWYHREHGSYKAGKPDCLALTKAGEPCSQTASEESYWCRYHQQPRSRGKNPALGQAALDRAREQKAKGKGKGKEPRSVDGGKEKPDWSGPVSGNQLLNADLGNDDD